MSQHLPSSYLHLLINFITKEYGENKRYQLALSKLGLTDDPSDYVSSELFTQVCKLSVKSVNDPALGLKFGHSLRATHLGLLGAAMISSSSVCDMFQLFIRFNNIRFPAKMELTRGSKKTLLYISYSDQFVDQKIFHSQCFLAGLVNTLNDEVGFLHKDIAIEFPHAQPDNIEQYRFFLPVALHFDKPSFAVVLPNEFMDYCLPKHDSISEHLFVELCENIQRKISQGQGLSKVIESMLDSFDHYPSLDLLALALNLSGRTLRSRLQTEKTSFREVISNHRIERSKMMLTNTNKTIDVLAQELGYSDPANFSRAFKKIVGISPSVYRRRKNQPG